MLLATLSASCDFVCLLFVCYIFSSPGFNAIVIYSKVLCLVVDLRLVLTLVGNTEAAAWGNTWKSENIPWSVKMLNSEDEMSLFAGNTRVPNPNAKYFLIAPGWLRLLVCLAWWRFWTQKKHFSIDDSLSFSKRFLEGKKPVGDWSPPEWWLKSTGRCRHS